jgi:hypothetical protein
MSKHSFLLLFSLALGLILAGCSTPETRIKGNLEAFNKATPQQQEMIKKGEVALDFTPDLVRLAIGDPDSVRHRVDKHGESEVWIYRVYEAEAGTILYSGYYHRYYRDIYPYYDTVIHRKAHEIGRITFAGGKVVSIEREKP